MNKRCSECKEVKDSAEFYKRTLSRDGLQSKCKPCMAKLKAINANIHAAKYRELHPDRCKEARAKWREANKEKIMVYNAQYHSDHAEERKTYYNEWHKANPKAVCVYNHNRKARKRGKLSKDIAGRLFVLQRGKCACCKQSLGKDYHLDHIVPLALGGTNTDDNIQLLRAECNMQKHAKHPVNFMQQRGYLL